MPQNSKPPTTDLVMDIKDLHRRIDRLVKDADLSRYVGRRLSVELSGDSSARKGPLHAANVELEFKPNHGLDYTLTTLVTDDAHSTPISSPETREALAESFVENMRFLLDRVEQTAQSRKEIARLAREVVEEARGQGLDLELLRIEPAPAHVFGKPTRSRDHRQVFYVHILMPHDDKGTLTEDAYTVDADDPQEFADYLRRRVLPECVELKQRFTAETQA